MGSASGSSVTPDGSLTRDGERLPHPNGAFGRSLSRTLQDAASGTGTSARVLTDVLAADRARLSVSAVHQRARWTAALVDAHWTTASMTSEVALLARGRPRGSRLSSTASNGWRAGWKRAGGRACCWSEIMPQATLSRRIRCAKMAQTACAASPRESPRATTDSSRARVSRSRRR